MAKKANVTATVTIPDPQTADDFYARGWSHYAQKEFPLAEADFRKALDWAPNNPEFLYGLAMALNAGGRQQEAAQIFEKTVERLENPPEELKVRFHMLARFARAHINRIKTGDWHMR